MATIYKVWGWDTFSSEEYSCGEFYSYDEAVAKCKEMEERVAQFQSPGLRDTFSIQTATEYNTGGNISGFLCVGTFEQIQAYLKEEDTVTIVSDRATGLVDKFYD